MAIGFCHTWAARVPSVLWCWPRSNLEVKEAGFPESSILWLVPPSS